MLSTHSKLHQGRYRILQNFWSDAVHQLYDANDELFGQNVVISETLIPHSNVLTASELESGNRRLEERFNFLSSFSHEAIIGVRDHFSEIDRQYVVSDTVAGVSVRDMVSSAAPSISEAEAVRGIERILDAMAKIAGAKPSISYVGLSPANIRVTRENEFKLLFFDVPNAKEQYADRPDNAPRSDIAFMPLEHIWGGLDLASQKAIANSYDDASLDILQSAPDIRSDIFSLGTIFYFLITGQPPIDALERSIEVLDGNPDPLAPPHLSNKLISQEFSDFLMRSMSLRREDRFESVASAARQLDTVRPVQARTAVSAADPFEDLDLLEIPVLDLPVPAPSRPHRQSPTSTVEGAVPVPNTFVPTVPTSLVGSKPAPTAWSFETQVPVLSNENVSVNTSENTASAELTFSSVPTNEFETTGRFEMPAQRHWMRSPISIAVAVVVLVGVSAIVLFLMNSGDSSVTNNQLDVKTAVAPAPVTSPEANLAPAIPMPSEPVTSAQTESQIPSTDERPAPNQASSAPVKNRPAVAETRPKQEAKPLPAETTPKSKKKVTVDDLISDN